jgi:hypothetical protein
MIATYIVIFSGCTVASWFLARGIYRLGVRHGKDLGQAVAWDEVSERLRKVIAESEARQARVDDLVLRQAHREARHVN